MNAKNPLNLFAGAALALALAAGPASCGAAVPSHQRVFIVLFENDSEADILSHPYFRSFARRGALLADYWAVAHPSQPNYVALTAGTTAGVRDDKLVTLDLKNIVDSIEKAGLSWKAYAEDYQGSCDLDYSQGPKDCKGHGSYVRRHVPLISFKDISSDPARCAHIVPARELEADLSRGALPDYSFFTPNLVHDGHDSCGGTPGPDAAAQWLEDHIVPLLSLPEFIKNTVVIAVFDEGSNRQHPQSHTYAALLGPCVKPGAVSWRRYTHYDLLRTIEILLGNLPPLSANDAAAAPIDDIWRPAGCVSR